MSTVGVAPDGIDPAAFRQVLGQYPTGVVVITALDAEGQPLGMTVGSFTSVSIDPPLVAFLPDQRSGSWRALRDSGDAFCVNILGAHQEDVCRAVATRREDKFADIIWETSPGGNPVIAGAVAYIDCVVDVVHDAGDHHIVVGRVQHLQTQSSSYPLLFFRGGYGSFRPVSLGAADADLVGQMRLVDLIRPTIESLAEETATEVSAVCLVGDDLVIAASAGQERSTSVPTRVGQRWPFHPPMGPIFAAWGDEGLRTRWLTKIDDRPQARQHAERLLEQFRQDGYALTVSPPRSTPPESSNDLFRSGEATITTERALRTMETEHLLHNPRATDLDGDVVLRSLSVPVLAADGHVVCALTSWGPQTALPMREVEERAARLLTAAREASAVLAS